MHCRVRMQLAEVLGPLNRWYCSQAYCQDVDDEDLLLTYYVKSGGAADFADRYDEAMDPLNRWYCSQFYRRDVREPEVLWEYYSHHAALSRRGSHHQTTSEQDGWSIAG